MSLSLTKPGGWVLNEKLTSAQITDIDQKTEKALDKTVAGDTLSGAVVCASAGRVVATRVVGADADTTYQPNGGNSRIFVTSLTTNRTYTLGTTGVVTGDTLEIVVADAVTFLLTVKQGATTLAMMGGGTTATITSGANYTAAAVQRTIEFVYDGTNWVVGRATRVARSVTITASGTFVVPPCVYSIRVIGIGGGGGGGGGANSHYAAGGNAAAPGEITLNVTPGTTLTNTIGAGGAGGAAVAGIDGAPGAKGNESSVYNGATRLCAFPGGEGGGGATTTSHGVRSSLGPYYGSNGNVVAGTFVPGSNGDQGAVGAGFGGGGGAGGLLGSGGAGGDLPGNSGISAAANSGAGGGGGANSPGGGVGTGGNGGSGALIYMWS